MTTHLQHIVMVANNTYSGSRYPGVPATTVETWDSPPTGKDLESPKSASLAFNWSSNNMFVVFISLCTIGGVHPECKYSNPIQRSDYLLIHQEESHFKLLILAKLSTNLVQPPELFVADCPTC